MDRGAVRVRLPLVAAAAAALCALFVLVSASVASATTLNVTSPNDSGVGSLRAEVALADDGDTVQIPASFDIGLTSGPINITKSVTIAGGGASTIVDAGGTSGVFLDTGTSGPVSFQNLTITGGNVTVTSGPGGGAAIDDSTGSSLTLTGVTVTGNHVTLGDGVDFSGGAVFENDNGMTVTNSTITDNVLTLPSGASAAGNQDGGAGLFEYGSGDLTITDSTFTGNSISGQAQGDNDGGAAAYNQGDEDMIVAGSTFSANTVTITGVAGSNRDGGGAIYNYGAGLSISASTIDGNTVTLGGSLSNGNGGGGAYDDGFSRDTVTGSTIAQNRATLTGTTVGNGGGGLYDNSTGLTALNSTFSDNVLSVPSGTANGGGGVYVNGNTSTLTFVTLADNASNQAPGGILNNSFTTVTLKNSLVAGNGAADCAGVGAGSDFASAGYNLEQTPTSTCALTAGQHDKLGANPLLGALANNGGGEPTHALLSGSPAIDAIPVAACTDQSATRVTVDQRGVARPTGDACDIGAYESNSTVAGSPPTNIVPPAITGTPHPGDRLSCSTGTWTNSPTGFVYGWARDGAAIAGAAASTYTVQILDEAATLTCTVTASNPFGSGSASSSGVLVALRGTTGCPRPSGEIHGSSVGPLELGMTREKARKALKRFKAEGPNVDDFCLFAGWGIRVAYPSAALLRTLPKKERGVLADRIVLALTANPHYTLAPRVSAGVKLSLAAHKLKLSKPFVVGANTWYFASRRPALGLLKVRDGVVDEVGLVRTSLNRTRAGERRFLRKFNAV
jgi:hypothetical protein